VQIAPSELAGSRLHISDELDDDPFRREGLTRRIAPFAAVAIVAEASLALPPGPKSTNYTILSVGLLVAAALCCVLPWRRIPRELNVIVPVLYLGSVLALTLDVGGATSGVGTAVLAPLIWAALYHRPLQMAIVVAAVTGYQVVTSLTPVRIADSALERRLFFWIALASLLCFAAHQLRTRIREVLDQQQSLIAERELALAEMTSSVSKLERRERESHLLSELGDTLQTCVAYEEAYDAIQYTGEQLFEAGALSLFNSSRNLVETVMTWGAGNSGATVFSPNDCWGVRRGRVHHSDDPRLACAHLRGRVHAHALCIPMVAQGDTVGVFQIFSQGQIDADGLPLALELAEQVGMWMANFHLRETLRNQSIRDPLTNLFNRRYMEETLLRELARASRDRSEIGIVQIDIDHFKPFNDTYGHDVGDALLSAFGTLLLSMFRDFDVPCRYGGEEFTLILPNSSLDETAQRAEALRDAVRNLRIASISGLATTPRPPTISLGIAAFPLHGSTAEILIRAADQALYQAKAAGRDCIVRAVGPLQRVVVGEP
jgi:diguanylate cyclase (GGDEF)-like protein